MNSKTTIVVLAVFLIIVLTFVLWQYLFSIYEVSFKVSETVLYADSRSIAKIEAVPLNALGHKAPFRVSPSVFEFQEGKDLVDIVGNYPEKGVIILRAKDKPGKIVLSVKTKFSLWPTLIEIIIRPNLA